MARVQIRKYYSSQPDSLFSTLSRDGFDSLDVKRSFRQQENDRFEFITFSNTDDAVRVVEAMYAANPDGNFQIMEA